MKKGFLLMAAAVALIGMGLAEAGQAQAAFFQTFVGRTRGGDRWFRPDDNNPPGFDPFDPHPRYRVDVFQVTNNSTCYVYSAQEHDGYLHLYQGGFDPEDQLTGLIAADDDGDLGVGTSLLNAVPLIADTYYLVTSGWDTSDVGAYQNTIHCNDGFVSHGDCFFPGFPRDQQVCLANRFAVKIDQISGNTPNDDGIGTPVRMGSSDSAFFWFGNERNFEVLVKMVNGCGNNGHWWTFFAATTNQGFRIMVGDSESLEVKTYDRAPGPPSPAETDVTAFSTCP